MATKTDQEIEHICRSEFQICSAKARDSFGNPCEEFWILWYADGVSTGGFTCEEEARDWAIKWCTDKL